MVGIDPASDGLARATRWVSRRRRMASRGCCAARVGRRTAGVRRDERGRAPCHWELLQTTGVRVIDLTPAAVGPFVVPVVNLDDELDAPNVNMVTCGGQATIPIVAAVGDVMPVFYAEIVSSIASKSAGPGTRANIDEFTETTSKALEVVGGAERGKAVIVLNPAEPPMLMRNTVYCLVEESDHAAIEQYVATMVARVQQYVPGFRLKQRVQFETSPRSPLHIPETGKFWGTRVSVFLEVTGAAHHLPAYAGNLDIMTSAAEATAERIATHPPTAAGARA